MCDLRTILISLNPRIRPIGPASFVPWRARAALLLLLAACARDAREDRETIRENAAGTVAPDPFVLGFLPSQTAERVVPDAERLGDFLSRRMGRRVQVVVPAAYEPLIEGFRFGHIHAAFLDGGPAWIAHQRTGAEVVLAEVNDGRTFYWAEAFVRADSPADSLDDVLGKRVAFTSRTGSSGFLMPIGSLVRAGLIKPAGNQLDDLERALQRSFASTVEAGGYRQALMALLDGRVDVAFGAHDAPERFLTAEQQRRVRPLYRFGRIPSHAVLVADDLPPEVAQRFIAAMLALNDSANIALLRAIYGVDGLEPATTEAHLGDFGRALSALPGMERTLLSKKE